MTETWFPRADASRIVLIGAGTFRDRALPPIAAVDNNLRDLKNAFTHPEHGLVAGQPTGHCTVLGLDGEPVDQAAVGNALQRAGSEADDLLLVYYSGHGLLDDDGMLYLTLKHTDPERLRYTALPLDVIKRDLATAPARARVLILDCCFSGRAIAAMATAPSLVLGQLPAGGTYTLTSTTATAPSHAPPGDRHSAFTAVLLNALAATEPLNMDQIYHYAESELRHLGLPSPQRRGTGAASWLALARGPLPHPPLPTPAPWRRLRPALLWPLAAAVIAAALAVPAFLLSQGHSAKGTPGASRSAKPSPTPSTTAPSPSVGAGSGGSQTEPSANPSRPREEQLTAGLPWTDKPRKTAWTKDRELGININDISVGYFVITPTRSCTVKGAEMGQSIVITGPGDNWTRLIITDLGQFGPDLEDLPVTFQITRGHGNAPHGKKACT
ncbi:caspase family protein [Streptomyces fulvorobeus]|uniref:Peptidase C14 caspase domain-containing protein n=1 Tax=Streptomyces fulvorobeus TaxID=284028 RepID=A0A7J0BZF8_9ACTN|nr:caspase family protein [Streptomyces fulvorobeus]NYE39407.1 hypothetical protein [Streptomyces fulvorobeus]GFM95635.1 hypothetical protein Sfulv_04460 [Streptomyces fulvorobeus]